MKWKVVYFVLFFYFFFLRNLQVRVEHALSSQVCFLRFWLNLILYLCVRVCACKGVVEFGLSKVRRGKLWINKEQAKKTSFNK